MTHAVRHAADGVEVCVDVGESDGAGQVRPGGEEPHQSCGRRIGTGGRDESGERLVVAVTFDLRGRVGRMPPLFAGLDHAGTTLEAATTPRKHASAAAFAVARVSGSGAASPS